MTDIERELTTDVVANAADAVLASVPDAVIAIDADRRIRTWNPAAETLLGYDAGNALGMDVLALTPPDLETETDAALARACAGETVRLRTRCLAQNGRPVPVTVSMSPLDGPDGKCIGTCAILRADADVAESDSDATERFYVDFYENASDMYLSVHPETYEVLHCNRTLAERLGKPKNEIVGKPVSEIYHPSCRGTVEDALAEFRSTGVAKDAELVLSGPDGAPIDVSLSVVAERDADGQIIAGRSALRDITERKQAERALIAANADLVNLARERAAELAHLTAIAENMAEGTWFVSSDTAEIVWANESMAAMLGYAAGELTGKPIAEMNAEVGADPEDVAASIIGDLERWGEWHGEVANRHKNGSTVWCDASVTTVDHPEFGRVWVSVHTDVSERNRARVALRESEARFRSTFHNAPIGMALVLPDGGWWRVNGALCDITGYTAAELLTTDMQTITHPDELDDDRAVVRELVEGRRRSYKIEKRYVHKSGREVWVSQSASLVRDDAGEPMYFVSHIEDITERKANELRRQELTRDLERSNADLEEFTSIASHDLQAPLRSARGLIDLFRETIDPGVLSDEQAEQLDLIGGSLAHMQRLISDLLEYSRIDSDIAARNVEPVSVADVHNTAAAGLADLIRAADAHVEIIGDAEVDADAALLAQVFRNLIENSINYRRPDHAPRITTSVETGGSTVSIAVADNGIGIDPARQEEAFEMFTRLTSRGRGTGVGLASVRRIVERHDGTVRIDSDGATGTTVRIELPAPRDAEPHVVSSGSAV